MSVLVDSAGDVVDSGNGSDADQMSVVDMSSVLMLGQTSRLLSKVLMRIRRVGASHDVVRSVHER